MTTDEYSPAELEAIRVFAEAVPAERERMLESEVYKELEKRYPQAFKSVNKIEGLTGAFVRFMPTQSQDTVEALQFLSYGIGRILERPEIQKSAEVTKALQAVHESVSTLSFLDTHADDLLRAFALPHKRLENKKIAKKLRTNEKELSAAISLFERWEESPELYRNVSEFARDCIKKEYIGTEATAKKWVKMWGSQLPADHPLRPKLGKLTK